MPVILFIIRFNGAVMNDSIIVQGSPGYYHCGSGALLKIEDYLLRIGCRSVFILHGNKSWKSASLYFRAFKKIRCGSGGFSGECTDSEVMRIAGMIGDADAVIGVGGGKILDTAKAAADKTGKPVITVPTLAATCSAWTPLSVMYDDAGRYIRFDVFPRQNLACFFDPQIVLSAPVGYLRSGIGDTLAKWYEAELLTRNIEFPSAPVRLGLEASRICRDALLLHGEKAVDDYQQRILSQELINVFESIIVLGGSVGGFAERFGRVAGAHSVHNGLTAVPETHSCLHGEKVAYGILVQLMLEERIGEVQQLVSSFKRIGLPVSMKDLSVTVDLPKKISEAACGAAASGESIHRMPGSVNKEVLIDAMTKLEVLFAEEGSFR
jgi:hydroxycarboxylate dehydrogenase A